MSLSHFSLLESKSKSIGSIYSTSVQGLHKSASRDLSTIGSRFALNNKQSKKELKETQRQKDANYKLKKQLEGEESEKEPETTGVFKWKWSKHEDTELYSLKFSPDQQYLVGSGGNGFISVYSLATNAKEFVLDPKMTAPVPCTSIAFRPDNTSHKNKNVLGATYADGSIKHWHITTGQLMSSIDVENVQFLHLDYSKDGSKFSAAASDNQIRVYDGVTHQVVFQGSDIQETGNIGHTNRIFCSKFHSNDDRFIVSGGWDDCVLVWDIRTNNPIRTIFGPHICGDSLDFDHSGTKLLTGSYSKDNNLQVWSWPNGDLLESIPWNPVHQAPSCLLYSAQYSKGTTVDEFGQNRFILAGGSGAVNEVRLFSTESQKLVGSVENLNCSIYSTAISGDDKTVAIGGGGKMLMVFEIDESLPESK
jgi:COMPASS component SWD3